MTDPQFSPPPLPPPPSVSASTGAPLVPQPPRQVLDRRSIRWVVLIKRLVNFVLTDEVSYYGTNFWGKKQFFFLIHGPFTLGQDLEEVLGPSSLS